MHLRAYKYLTKMSMERPEFFTRFTTFIIKYELPLFVCPSSNIRGCRLIGGNWSKKKCPHRVSSYRLLRRTVAEKNYLGSPPTVTSAPIASAGRILQSKLPLSSLVPLSVTQLVPHPMGFEAADDVNCRASQRL